MDAVTLGIAKSYTDSKTSSLSSIGRYLSTWNCTTGLPGTNPTTLPYTYKTGDYYIVKNIATSGLTKHQISMSGEDADGKAFSISFSITNSTATAYSTVSAINSALSAAGHVQHSGTCAATGTCGDDTVAYVASDEGTNPLFLIQDSLTSAIGMVAYDGTPTIVDTVTTAGLNYKPNGTSYSGVASATTDSSTLEVGDMYRFDGTTWELLKFSEALDDHIEIVNSYSALVSLLNSANNDAYVVNTIFLIKSVSSIGAYVSSISGSKVTYSYTTDSAFMTDLTDNGCQVGWVNLMPIGGIDAGGRSLLNNKLNVANPVATGSFSLGRKNTTAYSVGANSFAVGTEVVAHGAYSHAEGCGTYAKAAQSHAEGHGSITGDNAAFSHAEGYSTYANGEAAHSEGTITHANGARSHAEGYNTTASGEASHAEESGTTASGAGAHAEGYSTASSGSYAHAEGYLTTAPGWAAHAEGSQTKASFGEQHVQGKYNVEDSVGLYADIIGWGTSSARKNISALTVGGELRLKGNVVVECNDDSTGGTMLQTVPSQVTTGTEITIANNTEYILSDVTSLNFTYPTGNFECWITLSTASTGTIAITFPTSSYIGNAPTFANGQTWEISIKNSVIVACEVTTT